MDHHAWTLPSNTALAVGPEIEYVRVKCRNPYTDAPQTVILAKELLGSYFTPKMEGKFEISPVTYKVRTSKASATNSSSPG